MISWWNTMIAKNAPDMAWMRCVGITMGFPVEGLPVDMSSRVTAFHALRKKVLRRSKHISFSLSLPWD
jgi:hypothetical protein